MYSAGCGNLGARSQCAHFVPQANLRKSMKVEYAAGDEPVVTMPAEGQSAEALHKKLAAKVG